jgi:hypothetical protein
MYFLILRSHLKELIKEFDYECVAPPNLFVVLLLQPFASMVILKKFDENVPHSVFTDTP